jgi:SAM-dependent methyltransferase
VSVAAGALTSTEYDVFAPHYDSFTSGSDYERWTEGMLEHARAHGLAGRTLLDLACGTGNSFLPFLNRGFDVVGCDSSSAMLAEAACKAPHARLVLADLRALPVLGRFDLVTCFDDSLNYLPDEPDLRAAFTSIAANLSRGGLALFDLNTLKAYRSTFAHDSVREGDDGRVFAWRGESSEDAQPGCAAAAWIDAFVPEADGSYQRVRTHHAQRHFPRDRVTALLREAGLELVVVSGVLDDGALVADADELRHLKVLYTARRAKGGVPSDHQEDGQGPPGPVHHEGVVTVRGSARPTRAGRAAQRRSGRA